MKISTNEGFGSFIVNPGTFKTIFIIHHTHVPSPKWLIYLIVLSIFRLFHRENVKYPNSLFHNEQKMRNLFGYFTDFVNSVISQQCQFAFLPPTPYYPQSNSTLGTVLKIANLIFQNSHRHEMLDPLPLNSQAFYQPGLNTLFYKLTASPDVSYPVYGQSVRNMWKCYKSISVTI